MERWEVIAERAAEVLLNYEQKAGRPAFGPTLNVAEALEDIAQRCFSLEVMDSDWLEDGVLGELDIEGKKISVQRGLETHRRAFTVAHDMGHAALNHSPRIVDFEENIDEQVGLDELEAQDGVYRAYNSRDRLEIEANLFPRNCSPRLGSYCRQPRKILPGPSRISRRSSGSRRRRC